MQQNSHVRYDCGLTIGSEVRRWDDSWVRVYARAGVARLATKRRCDFGPDRCLIRGRVHGRIEVTSTCLTVLLF